MDDKEIKIDLKWFDNLLANVDSTQMKLFDDDMTTSSAATISTAASGNIYPYVVGGYTLNNNTTGGYSFGSNGLTFNDVWDHQTNKASLSVKGDAEFEGDVKIKGKSINQLFEKIEERLAILHPNEKLEEKWLELKKLGDAYRALEKDILEKEKIWETLKK